MYTEKTPIYSCMLVILLGIILHMTECTTTYNCKSGKAINLGDEPGLLSYAGNETADCEWVIPANALSKYDAMILKIINLTSHDKGCAAITLPGDPHIKSACNLIANDCWIYKNLSASCSSSKTPDVSIEPNEACENYNITTNNSTSIVYKKKSAHGYTSIMLLYQPVKCSIPQTTKATSTVSPLTLITTASTEMDATEITTVNQRVNGAVIAVIASMGVFIIILLAAFMIWYKRRSTNQELNTSQDAEIENPAFEDGTAYENQVETKDYSGYEIPTNARNYQNLGSIRQYENLDVDAQTYENMELEGPIYDNT